MSVKVIDVRQRLENIGAVIHHDDAARTSHRSDGSQTVKIDRDIFDAPIKILSVAGFSLKSLISPQNFCRGTSGNNCFQRPTGAHTAADIVNQLSHRDGSALKLVIARFLHMSRNTEDPGASVIRRSDLRVFIAAHVDRMLHVTERFDVVDGRRTLIKPEDSGKIRWFDPRLCPLPFVRSDQTGFLPADVSSGSSINMNIARVPGTEDIFSKEIFLPGFLERAIEDLCPFGHLAADVDKGCLSLNRKARYKNAFDQLMRIFMNNLTILKSARFGFVGIADQINRFARLPVEKPPFGAAGKSRTATSADICFRNLLAKVLRLFLQSLF